MILLFGQLPLAASVARQFVLHALVGSVGDAIVPPEPPISPTYRGGGGYYPPTYIRRAAITTGVPDNDEDLIAAITTFTLLENDTL